MGLDQYAYTAPKELVGDAQINMAACLYEGSKSKEGVNTDFVYWRKFSALHAWMQSLYESKGGEGDFNCQQVRLMPEDLDALQKAANNKELTPVAGFFWGHDEGFDEDDRDTVLDFVNKARSEIAADRAVIYDSWW